ncbi:Arsenite efflux transporter [Tolypocladium paradoxum]|uniref:Arsenite efflux transporter n=1 Tax=Tolypocladium paradoxum TaxID=94208 RepID=A0A2S4L1U7_9HYPO|nr:Arsenite efflux transporter [Tolypocladium paradoxum]
MAQEPAPDTIDHISDWRSIVTLVVFVLTSEFSPHAVVPSCTTADPTADINVLFPFHIPIYIPRRLSNALLNALSALRVIPPRRDRFQQGLQDGHGDGHGDDDNGKLKPWVRLNFPMNFVTAPLVADLFLLAILAIGKQEVHDGTIGADNISPIDIMVFFITLAYIAISIDASGLIRYLAFKVLQWGGRVGHRLFFCLYAFFFLLGSFIGNDPIILSGTAFLAYMTRVSSNIVHPRAWIHTQFAIANIASAILVSSNPTNLVLAGAFKIKFINYTANMIVPVVVTAIVLFPFLLYIVFANESLIPYSIKMHELPEEAKARKPVNPNIPHARGHVDEDVDDLADDEQGKLLSLEEIMNPFLDKSGAAFGAVVMAATLVTLLALNAASAESGAHPVFWVTLPGAFVMFCWDLAFGWYHREETRQIARRGRRAVENARAERAIREEGAKRASPKDGVPGGAAAYELATSPIHATGAQLQGTAGTVSDKGDSMTSPPDDSGPHSATPAIVVSDNTDDRALVPSRSPESPSSMLEPKGDPAKSEICSLEDRKVSDRKDSSSPPEGLFIASPSSGETGIKRRGSQASIRPGRASPSLVSLARDAFTWSQETFPTAAAVVVHLPFALVPFAFSMFILVQALVTKGWVEVFAHGWDHWVDKTGTLGSVAGMGFLSVVLCNFAGTNIGTTILLSRVIQAWQDMHKNGPPISDRTFWATVYSMALGVNYGAFSTAFSASLAGLLWRDILARKHIRVRSLDFARVNLPIISIAMIVGCAVLVAEVYIVRDNSPYSL